MMSEPNDSGWRRSRLILGVLSVLLMCGMAPRASGVTVMFAAPNVQVTSGTTGGEFENPLPGTVYTQGYEVVEWRDADYLGVNSYDDWVNSGAGTPDGNATEVWLRSLWMAISTTTTVPGSILAVHLSSDANDGIADIIVDGTLMAKLDMGVGPFNAWVLIEQLPNTTHTIQVMDRGPGAGWPPPADDVAILGASVLQPITKWSQPPGNPMQEFDAASDLWWPQPGIKWEQPPNPSTSGLHAHDWTPPYQQLILADDWICEGGLVTDFHWWGTVENPGAGISGFRLSIHRNNPGPCLPLEPPAWVRNVPIANITVTPTGMVNNLGQPIFKYDYVLPESEWFPQILGEVYWFDVSALSVNPMAPYVWLWSEAARMPGWMGACPASQKTVPTAPTWQHISWPGGLYSSMAFAVTSTPPEVNKVLADDFVSDGRVIEGVRWWGSYLDSRYQPPIAVDPYRVDGWLITFHWADVNVAPACPPDVLLDLQPTALGTYFVPAEEIEILELGMPDCLGHLVYQYTVNLDRTCLLCSEPDPRDAPAIVFPAELGAFHEIGGRRYWLSVQAVVGAMWWPPPVCSLTLTGRLPSDLTPDGHFWGWHTSMDIPVSPNYLDGACTGRIVDFTPYPPECWDYGAWDVPPYECPLVPIPDEINMAYELLTDETGAPCQVDTDCEDGNVCTDDDCDVATCKFIDKKYGDINGNGYITLADLFCVLNGFSGDFSVCTKEQDDIHGSCGPGLPNCCPNGVISLADLFAVLNAFAGIDPCCGGGVGPAPETPVGRDISRRDTVGSAGATIKLVPSAKSIRPGGTLSVDVFISGADDLRGYQVALEAVGGRKGELEVESVTVDRSRRDFVFQGQDSVDAGDPSGSRVLGALLNGGVATSDERYLATFTFRASPDGQGAHRIVVREGGDTLLLDSSGAEMKVRSVTTASVRVR